MNYTTNSNYNVVKVTHSNVCLGGTNRTFILLVPTQQLRQLIFIHALDPINSPFLTARHSFCRSLQAICFQYHSCTKFHSKNMSTSNKTPPPSKQKLSTVSLVFVILTSCKMLENNFSRYKLMKTLQFGGTLLATPTNKLCASYRAM